MVTLSKYVQKVVDDCGGIRAAARVLQIDNSYLSKLCTGVRTDPSDEVLKKLKLKRVIMFVPTRRKRKAAAKD